MAWASVLIGVPLDEVIKVEEKAEEVTRYNEKTGEPYQKKIKARHIIVAGKDITPELEKDIEEYGFETVAYTSEWLENFMPEGLGYISGSDETARYSKVDGLAGIIFAGQEESMKCIASNAKEIAGAMQEVQQSLEKAGLGHLEAKIYLDVSY